MLPSQSSCAIRRSTCKLSLNFSINGSVSPLNRPPHSLFFPPMAAMTLVSRLPTTQLDLSPLIRAVAVVQTLARIAKVMPTFRRPPPRPRGSSRLNTVTYIFHPVRPPRRTWDEPNRPTRSTWNDKPRKMKKACEAPPVAAGAARFGRLCEGVETKGNTGKDHAQRKTNARVYRRAFMAHALRTV